MTQSVTPLTQIQHLLFLWLQAFYRRPSGLDYTLHACKMSLCVMLLGVVDVVLASDQQMATQTVCLLPSWLITVDCLHLFTRVIYCNSEYLVLGYMIQHLFSLSFSKTSVCHCQTNTNVQLTFSSFVINHITIKACCNG